jgi:mono/diheme cytochrome c family protein
MKGRKTWLLSAIVLGGSMLAAGRLLRLDPAERGLEFAPDMARTPAIKSFTASPLLPGGTSMQPLAEGVVIRGSEPFEYGPGPEEQARAGRDLVNPFAGTDTRAVARGERVFGITCATCHGKDGETKPPAVQRGVIAPPSLLAAHAMAMKDGEIFHGITKGQGKMPAYASLIVPEDRWKAILYVRRLQQGGATTRPESRATRPAGTTTR